jgi:hypothetical protein
MASMYETNQVGKRQELLDKIYNIEAAETPLLSMLKVGAAPNQMLASWVGEVYPDVASTGVLDGVPATAPGNVSRYLMQGCAQHFRQEWGVTTLAQLTNAAGVGRNEAGHQMMLSMLLMKRQLEQQFLSADDAAAESGATPWTVRGIFEWLKDTAQANYPVPAALRPAAAALYTAAYASLDQDAFRTCLIAAAKARKGPVKLTGFVGQTLKSKIDDWTNVYPVASTSSQPRMQYVVQGNDVLKNTVDQLRFSAGTVDLIESHFLTRTTSTGAEGTYSAQSGAFLDLAMWQVAYLQKPANTNLAPDGSGKKGFVDAVAILKCLNSLGQVKVQPSS